LSCDHPSYLSVQQRNAGGSCDGGDTSGFPRFRGQPHGRPVRRVHGTDSRDTSGFDSTQTTQRRRKQPRSSKMSARREATVTRRELLRMAGIAGGAAMIGACTATQTQPTPAQSAPTAAPATAAPAVTQAAQTGKDFKVGYSCASWTIPWMVYYRALFEEQVKQYPNWLTPAPATLSGSSTKFVAPAPRVETRRLVHQACSKQAPRRPSVRLDALGVPAWSLQCQASVGGRLTG
jgi:hypothetical protein